MLLHFKTNFFFFSIGEGEEVTLLRVIIILLFYLTKLVAVIMKDTVGWAVTFMTGSSDQ